MADKLTPEQRHHCMASIKGKNTKPEMIVRRYLHAKGFRYRLHVSSLPGTPDIVLRKYRTVIFINGCFWHGHEGCRYFVLPKTRVDFWKKKIDRNIERDLEERIRLRDMGWHVVVVWECEVRTAAKRQKTLESLEYTLNHIYLMNCSSSYTIEEEPTVTLAAEEGADYRIS